MSYHPIMKPVKVSFVATYPPRKCGIGVFTEDLVNSLKEAYDDNLSTNLKVVALDNTKSIKQTDDKSLEYPREVMFVINSNQKAEYDKAADYINLSESEVVCIQHEFGIFGGDEGNYLLALMKNIKKPMVTSLHTVLKEPKEYQKQVLSEVCELSTIVVVLAEKAKQMLIDVYGVPEEKIELIHHGTPDVPFLDSSYYKDFLGAENNKVLLTFGLLSPNKGIEYAIKAMEEVVKEFPDALYLVLGATHPEVKKRYGEKYRISLERMVKEKNLEKNVVFHNRFVSKEELSRFLVGADIYMIPYLAEQQISSGTLAYALACGKAVISTPFWYASELLADDRGILTDFKDSHSMAKAIKKVLKDENLRNGYRKKAYQFGRNMIWSQVAMKYSEAFEKALMSYTRNGKAKNILIKNTESFTLPEINLAQLKSLTDDTGYIQHAKYTIPNRFHGYCTDDNVRALIVAIKNWELFHDPEIIPYMHTYLSFVHYAVNPRSGRVHNLMSFDRAWMDEYGSDDCHGRTVHAIGFAIAHAPDKNVDGVALELFKKILKPIKKINAPRAWAQIIIGCIYYLRRFSGDTEVKVIAEKLTRDLIKALEKNSDDNWLWFEDIVTYENGRIPQALISAGRELGDDDAEKWGMDLLQWLMDIQTDNDNGHISLIGNEGWLKRGEQKADYDQQSIEIPALVDACFEAYLTTKDQKWRKEMERCFSWFMGENDLNRVLYDFTTGGCFDGLHSTGVNRNQGGESTISWLMAVHRMYSTIQEDRRVARGEPELEALS